MKYNTFDQVIDVIKAYTKLPYDGQGEVYDMSERHKGDGDMHDLITKQKTLFNDGRFEMIQVWNYCPECRSNRNSKVVGFDNQSGRHYSEYFLKHGENRKTQFINSFTKEIK